MLMKFVAITLAVLVLSSQHGIAQVSADKAGSNGLGVSRDEMRSMLVDPALGFRFGRLGQYRNEPVLRGERTNGQTEVFLSGPAENLTSVAVFARFPASDPKSFKNLIYAATIMGLAVPGWDGEESARWLIDAATKAKTQGEQTTEKFGKKVTVAFGEGGTVMLVAIQGAD